MRVFPILMSALLLFSVSVNAQVFPTTAKKGELIILASVQVRKGEGCTSATGRTKFPLSQEDCALLLKRHNRLAWVDARNIMRQITMPPIVYPNEQFHYVVGADGNGWEFQSLRAHQEK